MSSASRHNVCMSNPNDDASLQRAHDRRRRPLAGLPILTCPGRSFPARVAASPATAAAMPELIMPDLAAYEETAVHLATHPDGLRARLTDTRRTSPLFDTEQFVQHLEQAYETVWARYEAGEPPAAVDVVL
jgi:hypothetical protein